MYCCTIKKHPHVGACCGRWRERSMTYVAVHAINFTSHWTFYVNGMEVVKQSLLPVASRWRHHYYYRIVIIGLMTSTHKSWLKITAPPAGYRKWNILYFDELLLAALQYTAQMSRDKSLDHGQNCDISSNRVNIEVRRRFILRQRRRCFHNSTVHCPITIKLLSNDQSPSLNSSMCQYFSSVS